MTEHLPPPVDAQPPLNAQSPVNAQPPVNAQHRGDFADYRAIHDELPPELVPWEDHPEPRAPREPRKPWPFGLIALSIAIVLVIAEVIAISMAVAGEFTAATVFGQILIALTALPVAVGVLAVIRRRNTGLGIAAIVLAIIANPFVQVNLLGFFASR